MKFRGSFFWLLLALSLVFSAAPLAAGSLGELFAAATESNQDYSIFKIDLELAQLKKTKGRDRGQGRTGSGQRAVQLLNGLVELQGCGIELLQ